MKNNPMLMTASLVFALLTSGCGSDQEGDTSAQVYTEFAADVSQETDPDINDSDFSQLILDNNRFTLAAYQQVLDSSASGQVISPFSIRSALAMMYAGAEGDTKAEMAEALELTLPEPALHVGFNQFFSTLDSRNLPANDSREALELNIHNAIWPKLDSTPNQDYLEVLAKNYGKGVYALDYEADPDAARQVINDQVEDWTEGKIVDLLPDGAIKDNTLMVLTSTIYLYAPWKTPFVEDFTSPKTFTNLDGTTSEVDTMSGDLTLSHGTIGDAKMVSMPFRGDELEMVFVVPSGDFDTFVQELDATRLNRAAEGLMQERVSLELPKFELAYTMPAVDTLKSMGMQRAFTEGAQFEPIGLGPMMITEVAHKAFIEVNEDGTEAAAATAVVGGPTSLPGTEIHIDKPFVFMIRDRVTGALLFIGHVAHL